MKKLEEVIEGCKRGDKLSQKELYDRYSSRYFVFCRRYAADDESAKDILIDGFLAVFQSVDTYSGTGSFEGWMNWLLPSGPETSAEHGVARRGKSGY